MTGDKDREVTISLDFLEDGKTYTLTSFEDGINADRQAMDYKKRESTVQKDKSLTLRMVRNGGWAGVLKVK